MSKYDGDPLRKWMNEKKVWQMDLYRLLQKEDVTTIKDFRKLSKNTFKDILKKAKTTGFMHAKRLQALYDNRPFPDKSKQKSKPKPKSTKPSKRVEDPEERDLRIRNSLEPWLKQNKVWQVDLFKLMKDDFDIETPKDFYGLDKGTFGELLTEAKQKGLIAAKVGYLKGMYGGKTAKQVDQERQKKKQQKQAKKASKKGNTMADEDPTEIRNNARGKLEPWMRKHKIWQLDLFDLMVNWDICSPNDFLSLDKDDFNEFFTEAKQQGLMGDKPGRLKALYQGKDYKKTDKKKVIKKSSGGNRNEEPTQEEIENKAYDVLKPWMTKNKIWQRDLLNVFFEYDLYTVNDFKSMDRDTFDEFFVDAKQAGLMGQKPKLLKELYTGKKSTKSKKKDPPKKTATKKVSNEPTDEEIEMQARKKLEPWMRKKGFWQRDLLNIFIEYDILKPSDLNSLDKDDFKEMLKEAKSKGLMKKAALALKSQYNG